MAHQAFSLPTYPKCIRLKDFEVIKSFDSFELYQSDYSYGLFLPVLSEVQFLTIQSFSTYADFRIYLFDTFERDWTSYTANVSCSQEQFEKDWDSAIAELANRITVNYANIEGEEDSISVFTYDQSCTKGRELRANRRKDSWLAQKRAFCTEEILKARADKEKRDRNKKVKSTQKSLLRFQKTYWRISKEKALKMAESMVCLKSNVSFTRARFAVVSYNGFEEIKVYTYKKRASKTFHEKHNKMKKCAAYHRKLQEIRDMTLKLPGHNRKEAKHACNIKNSKIPVPVSKSQENLLSFDVHPTYHNAVVRLVTGKRSFSFEMDTSNVTPVKITMSRDLISAKILNILCILNH